MAEPLIDWSETLRFLELLGRSAESVDALAFPPREGPGSDKGAMKFRLDPKGRQSAEHLLSMPLYRFHSLGIRPNPGGSKAAEITEGRAIWFEADGGLSIEAQEALPELLNLPPPSVTVWTGGKSLHTYWVAEEGEELSPEAWRKAQERLIAAVEEVAPEAGADASIKDPSRVMRCPGSIHPTTGERCRIHSASVKRYSLAALVEMLPPLPEKKETASTPSRGEAESLSSFPPRPLEEIKKAASFIPKRVVGANTYETSRHALCGCAAALAEIGLPEEMALDLLADKWPDRKAAESVLESSTTRAAGSFWAIAKEHGYQAPATEVPSRKADPSSPPPLSWSDLIGLTLEAVKAGDVDAEMELRAEIAGRFRRNDAQVDAALFRLLTEHEAGPRKTAEADSVDLRTVQGLDYLVDGFLPANGLTLSYGAKGAGKTTAAVALGFSVVDGRGFLDHSKPATAGKVLFIASDSGAGPLRTVIQEMGHGEHEALIPGEGQRFFVWAHEADQGHTAWDVSVRGCVKLLQFVKAKGISLVVIDSAKAVCSKAGLSYTDNDAVNALLTFMKEVLAPHASVLFLSHDGTAVGSHAGAKAWAEIVDVVHRQTRPEGDHRSRTWTVVKNRLGPTREFSYALEEGELVLAHGVETIGDATAAILKVLRDAHEKGDKDRLSRKGIHEEVFKRFDYAPKTIDNTLQRLVQGKAPKVVRKGKGFYALSPKELYRGCLSEGEEWHQIPSPAMDLPITQALPEGYSVGNGGRSTNWHALPKGESVGNGRVVGTPLAPEGKMGDSSPREGDTPIGGTPVSLFESVEVFQAGGWCNGWVVAEEGEELQLFRADDPEHTLRLDRSLVRPCQS